jgi:PTH1 family peptidyl-tRNA hydrolase
MKLIIGLGNPGPEYAKTRHNAGWMALDRIEARFKLEPSRKVQFHSAVTEGNIAGEKVLLLRPQTFMNRSGLAVGEAVSFYKLDPQMDLIILVDDLALEAGQIRIRASGSAGGHNGLTDVQRALGSPNYPRLRIGIDGRGRIPQVDYVLGRFTPEQLTRLEPALDQTANAIECWIKQGLTKAMTLYNG